MNTKNQAIQNVQKIQRLEKELAREAAKVAALKQAAKDLIHHLPEDEIELAREVWGNTNTNLVINYRKQLAEVVG